MSHNGFKISSESLGKQFSNSKKKYNFLVFIGRFQPLHLGHCRVIDKALELAETVLIFVGSSNTARTFRNPFTFEERKGMIEDHYRTDRIKVIAVDDYTYRDETWIEKVQEKVSNSVLLNMEGNTSNIILHGLKDTKVGLIGCDKDHTSFYLDLFPNWDSEKIEYLIPLNSTDIRVNYLNKNINYYDEIKLNKIFPTSVSNFLERFEGTQDFKYLVKSYKHDKKYEESWKDAPYAPKHLTVDSIVIQSGHVLLVRRKAMPGEGLLALPGGHVEEYEKLENAMVRELKEETKIKVPEAVLRGSIKHSHIFDDPYRSSIGRVVTLGFLIHLKPGPLPKVKGSDDAEKAMWVPLGELNSSLMFDDHYHIIQYMIGKI